MDRDRFNTLLADMDKITDQDIKSLNQLRKQYPYFQNQYIMIAKALKKRNHPKTDAFIKKAAIYSADRALLKAIIMDEHDFAPVAEEAEVAPDVTSVPEEVKKVTPPEVEAPAAKEVAEDIPAEKAEAKATTAEEKIKTTETQEEKPSEEPKPVVEKAAKVSETEVKETPPPAQEPQKAESAISETKDEAPQVAAKDTKPVSKPGDNQELIDELERDLQEIRKKKQLIAKMLEQQEAKQSPKKAASSARSASAKKKAPAPRKSQSELIEKFIRNEPQMGKQKPVQDESEHKNEDLSARFTKEQEDFYTETMAKLMVTQKKYRKAIQVYEKLGLKFPEKRAYFASQIEQVKSRSNV